MRFFLHSVWPIPFGSILLGTLLAGCVAFEPAVQSKVETVDERPSVAIVPFRFDLEITRLSAVKTVEGALSSEEESALLAESLREIQQGARWVFVSRLATGQGFRIIPLADTDALAEDLQMKPNELPNETQLTEFRRRLGADLVVAWSILGYGEIRWPWLTAGAFADLSAGTIALGRATAWNPIGILPMQASKC